MSVEPIRYEDGAAVLLDQSLLPEQEAWVRCTELSHFVRAIRTMQVRGAPLLGVTAAYALAVEARRIGASGERFLRLFEDAADRLGSTRPTAVNLFWAIRRMRRLAEATAFLPAAERNEALLAEAHAVRTEDIEMCRAIGRFGAGLLADGECIMTHCNAGALATAGYGTALGVVRAARELGKSVAVIARETRPLLQGARLTAWELARDGIDVTVIADGAAAHLMHAGKVTRVIVGADRIAANGDTANKIGTYDLAVVAREHGIPFHVAAPYSTVDFSLPDGSHIPIEERGQDEVTMLAGRRVAPDKVPALNPAFDVTPHRCIASIITEAGIAAAPLEESLKALLGHKAA